MKLFTIITCAALMFLMVSIGLAQIIAVETFDYELGAMLDGLGDAENGWGGPWETFSVGGGQMEDMVIVEPSEYPGLQLSGNRLVGEVYLDNADGLRNYRPLAETIVDDKPVDLWLSFLIAVESTADITQNASWQGVSFWSGTEQAYFGKEWGAEFWGIIPSSTGGSLEHISAIDYTMGEAWLVLKIEMSGGVGNEMAYMWVSPDPTTEPDIGLADVTCEVNFDNDITHIACHLGQVGFSETITTWFDELRLGYSFADVSLPAGSSVKGNNSGLPTQFELSQNFPNPFNPTTTIRFDLVKAEEISLKIYNVAGEEIETLASGHFAAGIHEVKWDASNQPSGIYFCKMQAGQHLETRKLILQR